MRPSRDQFGPEMTSQELIRSAFYDIFCVAQRSAAHNVAALSVQKYESLVREILDVKSGRLIKLPRHYALLKHYDVLSEDGDWKLVHPGGEGLRYVRDDQLFDIIYDAHVSSGHNGRDKLANLLGKKYRNITRQSIQTVISLCSWCRRKRRKGTPVTMPQSGNTTQGVSASPSSPGPVPIAPKKAVAPPAATPPPPEVCLRWNSYHSNMQATFPSLLNNEQFVDVTLACEGRSIKCHKVMLSACSSYFEELLSQNPCQHPIVFMRDLKFWEVQALVEFMYSGEVNVAQDKLPSLLAAAEALQIKGLTGPSTGGSSHDEDSLPVPEMDEISSHLHKRARKRKAPSTPFLMKSQIIGQGHQTPIGKPPQTKVANIPSHSHPITSFSGHSPREIPPAHQQSHPRVKQEQPSTTISSVKMEPLELPLEYTTDQGESDTGQSNDPRETSAPSNNHHDSASHHSDQGSQGILVKAQQQGNGLSDDERTVSSDCSDERFSAHVQMDPGDSSNM